jgi:hypothetical protein
MLILCIFEYKNILYNKIIDTKYFIISRGEIMALFILNKSKVNIIIIRLKITFLHKISFL